MAVLTLQQTQLKSPGVNLFSGMDCETKERGIITQPHFLMSAVCAVYKRENHRFSTTFHGNGIIHIYYEKRHPMVS